MNHTIPVRITLKFDIAQAAEGKKEQFDDLNRSLAARSFIRGSKYSIIQQEPVVIEANVTRKYENELRRKEYVASVERVSPDITPLKTRESFYRARISAYRPL